MLIYTSIQFDFNTHTFTAAKERRRHGLIYVEHQRRCESKRHTSKPTCMDRYAAESRTERFWASFQLSLRTNLSIERKSGNESKHSDAITHIHTHKRARNRVRVSFGCWWNGKLIRSSVDLFKVYFRIGWCACVCVYVFILFVSGDSFSTRDSAIFSFAIVCVYSAVYNIEICMNVWPSSILFRWLCALSTCYTWCICAASLQSNPHRHTHRMYSNTLGCQVINVQNL